MPATNWPSTVSLRYPLTRKVSVPVDVVEFLDGTEQRWRRGPVLNSFSLTLDSVPKSDVDDVQTWFLAQKGAYRSDWSIPVGSETFTNMGLDQDELVVTETEPCRYSISLQIRQTSPSGTWPTVAATFPGLANGLMVQRPWSGKDQFLTTRNDMESGARYAYYEWVTQRRAWSVQYSVVTPAELVTFMQFFVSMGGRWGEFSFTDPDSGTTYTHTRFDAEEFQAQYIEAGHCSVTLPMVAVIQP